MPTAAEASAHPRRRARRLGIARDYDQLQEIMRARADELGISRETIDHITGLPPGYAGKLLGKEKVKVFGRLSTGLLLKTFGVVLVVIEDPEALARMRSRYVPRDQTQVRKAARSRKNVPALPIVSVLEFDAFEEIAAQCDIHYNGIRDPRGRKRSVRTLIDTAQV